MIGLLYKKSTYNTKGGIGKVPIAKEMMKKVFSICLLVLLTLAMVACGSDSSSTGESGGSESETSSSDTSSTSDDVIQLNFYEHSDNETAAQALVDAYNAQSDNIKVSLSIIANDDYDDKIKVMLSGGADVDCFWLRGGAQARQLANNGALYPIDDLMEANDVDYSVYGDMGDAFIVDDKTYGLCTTKSCWLLWYNKDLFDAAGVDYPIDLTWEEYTELAAQLKTDDIWGSICPNWTMNLGASAVGEYLTDDDLTKTREYADYMTRWYQTDQSHPGIEDMSSGSFDVNAMFAGGESYMMINGDWTFLLLPDSNPDFTWAAAPLPIFEGADAESTVGSTSSFSISASCEHPEAAFDFIKFCCYSDEGAQIYAENSSIPAYSSDAALETYKEKVTVPGVDYVFSANVAMEQGLDTNYQEINDAFKEEVQDALVGNITMDQAFDNFVERREEIQSK